MMMGSVVDDRAAVAALLARTPHLATGLGTLDEPCSIAAINVALTGKLTDTVPDCMSLVIGKWIIRVQDSMPAEMRDSPEWRAGLVAAVGTGRDVADERARLRFLADWVWERVLPSVQPTADGGGFGKEWAAMLAAPAGAAGDARAARAAEASDAARADAWRAMDPVSALHHLTQTTAQSEPVGSRPTLATHSLIWSMGGRL